jgi:hypothetical protein
LVNSVLKRIEQQLLIKPGERQQFIYFLILFMLIGAGMALGRGSADALFYKRYGIEYLPMMYVILGVLLMLISTGYAAFSDLMPAERFFRILFIVLSLSLAANWLLITLSGHELSYPLYFLVYEIASELLLVHSTLYMSQNLETQQAKRLSPLIFAGLQIGTISGGLALATTAKLIGVQNILLIWGLLLVIAVIMITAHHRRYGISPYFRPARKTRNQYKQAVEQVGQGLRFMRQSELLRSLSFGLFFMVIAFYVLYYCVGRIYTSTYPDEESLTTFFGTLTVIYGSTALLIQVLLTNRAIRRFGVKNMNLVFPVTTLISFTGMFISFSFPMALLASFNKDTMMPAIRNPVSNLFFNALPAYMQGRARAMAVALVLPLALCTTGLLLILAQKTQNTELFLIIGLIAAMLYLYHSMRMNNAYVNSLVLVLGEKVLAPESHAQENLGTCDEQVVSKIINGVRHKDDEVFLMYAELLISASQEKAMDVILPRLQEASHITVDRFMPRLVSLQPEGLVDFLRNCLLNGDDHLRASALFCLVDMDESDSVDRGLLSSMLTSGNPRLQTAAIYTILQSPQSNDKEQCHRVLQEMLDQQSSGTLIAAMQLLSHLPMPEYLDKIINLRNDPDSRVIRQLLETLQAWHIRDNPELISAIEPLLDHADPVIRLSSIQTVAYLDRDTARYLAESLLEDISSEVVKAAISARFPAAEDMDDACDYIIENRLSPRSQHSLIKYIMQRRPHAELIRKMAYTKTEDAHTISIARDALQNHALSGGADAKIQLLNYLLQEREQQVLQLVLLLLEHMEDPRTIAIIREGLLSGDRRFIANASEAIRHISNKRLAIMLGELLDDVSHQKAQEASKRFPGIHSILEWCQTRQDPWMQQVAGYSIARA